MQSGSESSPHPPSVNIWCYKPWWCQPWSILSTGIGLIVASWVLLRLIWVTALVTIPIALWMGFFLGVYPKLMSEELTQGDRSEK